MSKNILYKQRSSFSYKIVLLLFSFVIFVFAPFKASASEMNFTVGTNLPSNQIDKNKSFFDLKMKPGQKQMITVSLNNNTSKSITVNVGANSAKTNLNGVIEYGKTSIKNDKTLKYPLNELIKYPKSVVIPAKESKTVSFSITMPKKTYRGIILGGLTFQQKASESNKESTSKKGTTIQNRFVYAIAVILKESDDKLTPNLNLLSVSPGQVNGRNEISARIQNDQSLLMSSGKITAKIYKKGSNKVIYSSTSKNLQIAPNSNFKYPVYLKDSKMQSGNYILKLKVTATAYNNSKTWNFSKNFSIKAKKAASLNKSDVNIKKSSNYSWIIPAVIASLILVIILLTIIIFKIKGNVKKNSN
ncbi:DUF916 and DUF3324 domain-containing protein [Oenococcus oeni]|uniref:DUF916 and DUF3324 domain-containing protein n=1 Tax=Oenococcus oeni TaxID=1247 RepID=UPI0029551CD3|nr:DUF916 and DUF3324 domain-containing protein [Oenococcus oeni]